MRIIAALVVIFGHAHPLSTQPDPVLLGNSVQSVAVKIFFVISGFLVAKVGGLIRIWVDFYCVVVFAYFPR
ncbi:MAG: acyltransferase family protein [Stenotrophomonas maltophilia]